MSLDLSPFVVSLRLGLWVTGILLLVCFPLAWALSRARGGWAIWLESLVSLPLFLSPTVLGFYLLLALSPRMPFGRFMESAFHIRLAFSFAGITIGGCVSGMPFMLTALKSGMMGVSDNLVEASYTLGKGRIETIVRVVIPNMKAALLAGIITAFAHAMGEFGVMYMIGGSVPGKTRVVSIAIYERVEALDYAGAGAYALLLLAGSYIAIFAMNVLQRKGSRR